jgi:hypothetical protein
MTLYRPRIDNRNPGDPDWSWLVQPLPFNDVTLRKKEGPLAKLWKPITVKVVRRAKTGDFYQIMSGDDFAVNEKARRVLEENFSGQLETLPLIVRSRAKLKLHRDIEKQGLFAIHALQYVELARGAKFETYHGGYMRLVRYKFRQADLAKKDIFQIAGRCELVVSERFRDVTETARLRGLRFDPVPT